MDAAKNKIEIQEAWFLFSRDQHGWVRCVLWIAIGLLGIVFSKMDELESISNSYLIFTVSIMMEFFPSFTRYPKRVHQDNRALMLKNRRITIAFFLFVTAVCIASLVLTKLSADIVDVHILKSGYLVVYILIFIYLVINCVMGMLYIPPLDAVQAAYYEEKQARMARASEHGNLGDPLQTAAVATDKQEEE